MILINIYIYINIYKQKNKKLIARYQFQYFLKVVSTNTVYLNGEEEASNQYSVTEHDQDFSIGSGSYGLPGMYR